MEDRNDFWVEFDDVVDHSIKDTEQDHCHPQEQHPFMCPLCHSNELQMQHSVNVESEYLGVSVQTSEESSSCTNTRIPPRRKDPREREPSFVLRTRSETDVIEDGYKWRKYGKKAVKSSPYPRNYYKCSERSCELRKVVERDPLDKSMVLITYKGTHNHHQGPGAI